MSTQESSAGRTRRPAAAALVALALTAAVLVIAIQASSITSTRAPQAPRVPAPSAPTVTPGLRTSSHIPKGCRPKFGCGHGARITATRP